VQRCGNQNRDYQGNCWAGHSGRDTLDLERSVGLIAGRNGCILVGCSANSGSIDYYRLTRLKRQSFGHLRYSRRLTNKPIPSYRGCPGRWVKVAMEVPNACR
jgi:hypothetical protein